MTAQGELDVQVPGHGGLSHQPGLVDVGGRGRLQQGGQAGRQDRHEEIRQEDAPADQRPGRAGMSSIFVRSHVA